MHRRFQSTIATDRAESCCLAGVCFTLGATYVPNPGLHPLAGDPFGAGEAPSLGGVLDKIRLGAKRSSAAVSSMKACVRCAWWLWDLTFSDGFNILLYIT